MNLTIERQKEVLNDIQIERHRQDKKWGVQRHTYPYWLTILVEEIGEVSEAMQKNSVAHKQSDADDLYEELIQVAAVACAIAEQIKEERYDQQNNSPRPEHP